MDKAYNPTTWENRPSTASPLDEINLNALSRGVSTIDDRVIALASTVEGSVAGITVNETTGQITIRTNDGHTYDFNPSTQIYNTISANQQAVQIRFQDVAVNFQDVHDLLDNMDAKVDLTAENANRGITNLQTQITQNDGYYRQEMTGIKTDVTNVGQYADALNQQTNNRITSVSSSITQTTEAIQLSVSQLSQSVSGSVSSLQSQINQTAGSIALKVSKLEVIDDLQHEFGSGIEITPDRITFASTGAMVVNTDNFKLDEEGNAEFKGHVAMDSGSVGGVPLMANPADSDNAMAVQHANNSWKLRSALIDKETGLRYYTYMTKNKHLIVSDDESAGHTEENDKTDECTIGSKGYPWGAGYFKKLLVNKHSVIPEGIEIKLTAGGWASAGQDYWVYLIDDIEGLMPGKVFFSVAANNQALLNVIRHYDIEAACVYPHQLWIIANAEPDSDIDGLLILAEDYDIPVMKGAVLTASFDGNYGQLSCNWESPDTGSVFFSWVSDEICIEEWDETNEEWVETTILPAEGEEPLENDQFEDDPCIIG